MQNVASTGLVTFRTGSGADKYIRAAVLSAIGGIGLYFWAKDSESAFWGQVAIPVYKRSKLDEEWLHTKFVHWLSKGRGPFDYSIPGSNLKTELFGKQLGHPVMLGAGLDRNGECVFGCLGLGFSGVEIGSITPQKQGGSGMPRLFKFRADDAIIHRLGNPSRGLAVVSYFFEQYRLWESKVGHPSNLSLIGANIARNKISSDLIDDARIGVKIMSESADYIAITLPIPNSPGENIIKSKEWLSDIVASCHAARQKLPAEHRKPILFKLTADATETDRKIVSAVALEKKLDGLILSGSTITRPGLIAFHHLSRNTGTLSGEPVKEITVDLISDIYKLTKGKVPIIGSGGISSGRDALNVIEAGASAVQLHTALVTYGPPVVPAIKRQLSLAVRDHGYENVTDAVGAAHKAKNI